MTTQVKSQTSTMATSQSHVIPERAKLLQNALRANGTFSLVSGLLFTLASTQVADFMGITETSILGLVNGQGFILGIGIVLVLYAIDLFYMSARPGTLKLIGTVAIAGDIGWCVLSWLVLLANALPLTTGGGWAVLIISDIVMVFAIVQFIGLRRMNR